MCGACGWMAGELQEPSKKAILRVTAAQDALMEGSGDSKVRPSRAQAVQRDGGAAHTFPFVASSMEESDVILNAADGDEEKEPADKRGAQPGDARASRST